MSRDIGYQLPKLETTFFRENILAYTSENVEIKEVQDTVKSIAQECAQQEKMRSISELGK